MTEHESLGHFIAPAFTTKLATQKLMKTTQEFIQQLQRSHLSRYELRLAYFTILLPRLTYTFAITSYDKSVLSKLQTQITKTLIPRLGYSAKTPSEVVYGSLTYGGIGLRDLYIEQGIAKINILF